MTDRGARWGGSASPEVGLPGAGPPVVELEGDPREGATRRQLLGSACHLVGGLLAVTVASPLLFWWRSARYRGEGQETWADLGSPHKLENGEWTRKVVWLRRRNRWRREVVEEAVFVRRDSRRLRIFSAICPHQGCLVRRQSGGFFCPCHESTFDADGRPVDGPSPRPLDALQWKVKEGRLQVRYQRFRPGVEQAEPLEG